MSEDESLTAFFEDLVRECEEMPFERIKRERRASTRHGFELCCTLEQYNGVRRRGRTRDLSDRGVCVLLDYPMALREVVGVEVKLAWDDITFTDPLKLPATVTRCQQKGPRFEIGARFNRQSIRLQTFIHMYGQYVDEARRLGAGEPLARMLAAYSHNNS